MNIRASLAEPSGIRAHVPYGLVEQVLVRVAHFLGDLAGQRGDASRSEVGWKNTRKEEDDLENLYGPLQ